MVDIGRDPVTGKRRQRRIGPYTTRREAERAAAKAVLDAADGLAPDPRGVTLREYLMEIWLPAREARGLKPTTLANYRWVCERYLIPGLGSVRLRDLHPPAVTEFFRQFAEEPGRGGKPRSRRTIELTHRVLSLALDHAVRAGVLGRNPAAGARDDLPRGSPSEPTGVWGPDQLRTFLAATRDDRLGPLWLLAATTGMRRGELCGLRWEDVDLGAGLLTVRHTRVMVHGIARDSTPKTAAGVREVALDAGTVAALREQRARQKADRLAAPPGMWDGQGHVFSDELGRPLIPEYVTKAFVRAVRRAGLPKIRLHDLRHSYATLLLDEGVPLKVVADRLGHSTTRVTEDLYQHRVDRLDREAAARGAARLLPGTSEADG